MTVGYPSVEATLEVVPRLVESGCDLVELGIPSSNPLADGPTIQAAHSRALRNGVTTAVCLDVAHELSRRVNAPLLFMTYANPVLACGLDAFCGDCERSGIDGLIVPDWPSEEADDLDAATRRHHQDLIYLVAPANTESQISYIAARARGFLYLMAVSGVTGARATLDAGLADFVARVRRQTDLPLCVGFGISTPEQARRVAESADGVIVGSRLVQHLGEEDGVNRAANFVRELRAAVDAAAGGPR